MRSKSNIDYKRIIEYNKEDLIAFDIETFASVFSIGFMNCKTGDYDYFEISAYRNDAKSLYDYLAWIIREKKITVSFNGMFFDVPVVHFFLSLYEGGVNDPDVLRQILYEKAQEIIHSGDRFHKQKNPRWIDVDLYKTNHYDNINKATSLKKIEVFLRMDSVQELPHDFHDPNLTKTEVDQVVYYMQHDVLATKLFLDFCEKEIIFRFGLMKKFGVPGLNYSDSKIGAELMNKELIDKMGYDKVYKMVNGERKPIQTEYPDGFDVAPLIFDYIKFETPEGNAILDFFKSQHITIDEESKGTGVKGVFDKLDMNDVGELSKYVEHVLTNTEINKQNTRKYLDQLRKTLVTTEGELIETKEFPKDHNLIKEKVFNRKGYPLPPKDAEGVVIEDYARMGKYFKVYWDWISYSENQFWEIWPECKETFTLPTKLKKLNLKFGNIIHYWGTGGLHSSVESGVYQNNEKYILIDADVVSFYPSLSIVNFLAPKQYSPEIWVDTYGDMKIQRISYERGSPENKALKLALNSTYGNSGNRFSPIRDPAYTVATCISGQLTLTMLMEQWLKIPGLKLMSANTDGANAAVPREHIDWFIDICEEFEKITKLQLEFAIFNKMNHRDVNNFLYDVEIDELKIQDIRTLTDKIKSNSKEIKLENG